MKTEIIISKNSSLVKSISVIGMDAEAKRHFYLTMVRKYGAMGYSVDWNK